MFFSIIIIINNNNKTSYMKHARNNEQLALLDNS